MRNNIIILLLILSSCCKPLNEEGKLTGIYYSKHVSGFEFLLINKNLTYTHISISKEQKINIDTGNWKLIDKYQDILLYKWYDRLNIKARDTIQYYNATFSINCNSLGRSGEDSHLYDFEKEQ